jgi:hypothetical protein
MRVFKLFSIFFITALFLMACNKLQPDQVYNEPYQTGIVEDGPGYNEYESRLARENLDLRAVGELLEKAKTPEEFEYMLNDPQYGVNNLDLNNDGYADFISVREFDDRYDDQRGFSLFDMFGNDLIQEIATIIFNRDRYNNGYYYPGSRVLIRGNENLYGDNSYYETNWLDRSVPFVTYVFSNRDDYYNSPYYYGNYPSYYEPYQVVEVPTYQTRIQQYYTQPVFVQTTQPTVSDIKIVSPYRDKSLNKVYNKLPKLPRDQQAQFRNNNPGPPDFVRERQEKMKDFPVKEEKQFNNNPNKFERREEIKQEKQQNREWREKPNRQERDNVQQQNQQKFERQNQQRAERQMQAERQNQMRVERQNQQKVERQNQKQAERQQQQMRVERQPQQQMKPQKQENRPQPNGNGGKGNGGGNNRGNGGGGGGKGKGKP